MVDQATIERINELAHKKKTVGLTIEEALERKELHKEYIEAFKADLRAVLNTIEFLEEHDTPYEENLKGNPSFPTGEDGSEMLDRMNQEHREMTDWALDFVKDLKPHNILDVGCGGGAAIFNLHQRFPEATIYGIDISDVSVAKTLDYNRDGVIKGTVRINRGDVEELPYGDNFFDLVISVSSYFFWPDMNKALDEIKRVLKPGGTLLLISAIHKGVDLEDDKEFVKKPYVHNFLTTEDFKNTFKSHGFVDIVVHTVEGHRWICAQAKKPE